MKKLLFTGLMSVSVLAFGGEEQASKKVSYWGKAIWELGIYDQKLNSALWQAYWDTRQISFLSLFTSRFSKNQIARMQKDLKIINAAITGINEELDSYYGRPGISSQITDSNNIGGTIAAHLAMSPFLILEGLLGNSNKKNIDKMLKSRGIFVK